MTALRRTVISLAASAKTVGRPGDIPGIMEYSGIDKGITRY